MEVKFFNKRGEEVKKKPLKLKWVDFDIKKEFEHFMIKEIYITMIQKDRENY